MKLKIRLFLIVICLPILMIACGDDGSIIKPDIPVPTTPINIKAEVGDGEIVLTWSASSNADHYNIYRSIKQDDKNYPKIGTTQKLTFSDKKIVADQIYFYKIAGVSPKGEVESDHSTSIQITYVIAVLTVDKTLIDFGEEDLTQHLTIGNSGGAALDWELATDADWISFDLTNGTLDGRKEQIIEITANRNLAPGRRENTITITSPQDKPKTITVRMTIPEDPTLAVNKTTIDFKLTRNPIIFNISNSGTGNLKWMAEKLADSDWISVSPIIGNLKAGQTEELILKISVEALKKYPPGERLTETISIKSADQEKRISVFLDVELPILSISKTAINFGTNRKIDNFTVKNGGSGKLEWQIEGGANWIKFDPKEGESEGEMDRVVLTVDRENLIEGPHTATLTINAGDFGKENITISLEIPPNPILEISEREIDFGDADLTRKFEISNVGTGLVEWQINGGADWLQIDPREGNTRTETDLVVLTVDRENLPAGEYTTSIKISAGRAGSETLPIKMSVPSPIISLSTLKIDFGKLTSDAPPKNRKPITIRNTGAGKLKWKIESQPNWISVENIGSMIIPPNDETKIEIVISDFGKLIAGQHEGVIVFSGNGGRSKLKVKLFKIGQISGQILHLRSGLPIQNAKVETDLDSDQSDQFGEFVLPFSFESIFPIRVQAEGFFDRIASVSTAKGRGEIEIYLAPIAREIAEIRGLNTPKRIAIDGGRAIVSNEIDNSVSVIDIAAKSVIAKIDLVCDAPICSPFGVAISPNRSEFYVVLSGADQLNIISQNDNKDKIQIRIGDYPTDCVISADGKKLYVSLQRENVIAVIDPSIPTRTNRIKVGEAPSSLAISADGKKLYVCNYGGDSLSIVDLNNEIEDRRIPVGNRPDGVAITEKGAFIYVVNEFSGDLSIIDRATLKEVDRIEISQFPVDVAVVRFDADGREIVYVADNGGQIAAIEMPTKQIIRDIGVNSGSFIELIRYDKINEKFFVIDADGGTVTILE